jgi:hypothetical protein
MEQMFVKKYKMLMNIQINVTTDNNCVNYIYIENITNNTHLERYYKRYTVDK